MTDPRKTGPGHAAAGGQPDHQPDHQRDPWGMLGASWTASLETVSAWSRTWQSLMQGRAGPPAELMLGALGNPAALPQSMAPLLEEFRRALALPRFADLPQLDESLPSAPEASLDLALLLQEYVAAVMPVWMKACESFQAEVAARRAKGETPDLLADGLDSWNRVLDRTLMEFNRSKDFASLQQRMLRVAMRQRQDLRRGAERTAEAMDLPTRTEMRDVYGRLHGLMREVHALRREVRVLKAQAGPSPADAEAAGPRP